MKNHSFKLKVAQIFECNETAYMYLKIVEHFAAAQGLPFATLHEQRKALALYEWYAALKN